MAGSVQHLWPKETLVSRWVALQSPYTRSGDDHREQTHAEPFHE